VVIFLTAVIVIVAFTHFLKLDATLRELAEEELPEVHTIWNIRTLLSGVETDLTHVLIGHDVEMHLVQIRSKQSAISASLSEFRQFHPILPAEPEEILRELTARYASFEESTKDVVALVKTGQTGDAKARLAEALETDYRTTVESLDRLLNYEDREVNQTVALALAEGRTGRQAIAILSVVAALLSVALALGITASLTKPITKLVEATERVARGDLTAQAEIFRADEIGLLAERFNGMVTRLNELI
jgi:methyl-accepting chemotaxis protein